MSRAVLRAVALGLAAAAVLAQVCYPLLDGPALRAATVLAVVLFCGASLTHAAATRGGRSAAAVLVVAGGLGLVAEAVGVAAGVPFGEYRYTGSLGPEVVGVPVVVPLAWAMMAWPVLLAARTLVAGHRPRWLAVPVAAWLLASWDLFLDPQMVAAGHWVWRFPDPGLPGVPGIPLTNYAGWLIVSAAIVTALHAVVPMRPLPARAHTVPAVLLGWTWLGSTLANAVFFGRPAVAAYGFVAMGVVVLPYLQRVRAARPQPVATGPR